MYANRRNSYVLQKSGSRNTMVTSDFRPEVEIWPFHVQWQICNITLIICYRNSSVVVELLWGRYHVPRNVFLVYISDAFDVSQSTLLKHWTKVKALTHKRGKSSSVLTLFIHQMTHLGKGTSTILYTGCLTPVPFYPTG